MIAFIDQYRSRFSVEFICETLSENLEGGFITSRGYRDVKTRVESTRTQRDRELVGLIRRIHAENYAVYGVRKIWHALGRLGVGIGREQTRRLMRLAGVQGKSKGRMPITTRPPKTPDTRPDLVNREFPALALNRLWVADITYVPTRKGVVYAAFVTDVFSRKIVGWVLSPTVATELLPSSVEPGDSQRQGDRGFGSSLGSRLTVRFLSLQPEARRIRDNPIYRIRGGFL